jgi:hypothetical protein
VKIRVGTDGVGKTLEVRRDAGETDGDEVRVLTQLIRFLMNELQKKL